MGLKTALKVGLCTLLLFCLASTVLATLDAPVTYTVTPTTQAKLLSFVNYDFTFTNATIRSNEAKSPILVTVQPLNREPIAKFALPKRVYQYVTFDANESITPTKGIFVTIDFIVPREWVVRAGSAAEDVKLFFYGTDGWVALSTEYLKIDGNNYYFRASPNRFGFFAVALEAQAVNEVVADTGAVEVSPNENSRAEILKDDSDLVFPAGDVTSPFNLQLILGYGLLIFAATGVLIIGASYILPSKKNNNNTSSSSSKQQRESLAQSTKSQEKISEMVHLLEKRMSQKQTVTTNDVTSLLASVRSRYGAGQVASHQQSQVQPQTQSIPKNDTVMTPTQSTPLQVQSQSNVMLKTVVKPVIESSSAPNVTNTLSQPIADTISQSSESVKLKENVDALEPTLAKRYVSWAKSQGHDDLSIRKELQSYHISDSIITQVLSFDDMSQKTI